MFQRIFLILNIYVVAVVHCQACAEFSIGSSNYKATFVIVTHFSEFKTWNELKRLCDDGYNLVSINTEEENNAILGILQENCTNGAYAIGLSRESGSDRTMASSWNWTSGETVEYLYWGSGEPNVGDNQCAIGYISTSVRMWNDYECDGLFGNWDDSNGYGYICEKVIPTTPQTYSTTVDPTEHPEATTYNQLTSLINTTTADNVTSNTITPTALVNENYSTFSTVTQISSTGLGTTMNSGTTNGLTPQLSTHNVTISDAVTNNVPTESTTINLTTTSKMPSTVVDTSTHSDITTNGLTTVPKISIRKDITSNTITTSEKEEPGESRPTDLIEIVLPSVSAFLIIVILILILYRCHGRLICRKETKANPDYEMSTSMTSKLWKGSSPNGSDTDSNKGSIKDNDIPEQKSINTKHESENNSSRVSSSLSEANPTYEGVGPGDKIRLLSGPTSDDCNEGEVENPVYGSYTVESDYAVVDQPCDISSNFTTFGKPIGSGESGINYVTKTNTSMTNKIDFVEESPGTDKDDKMCTGSSPPNIDDSKKVQNVEELYAKPDMSKKSSPPDVDDSEKVQHVEELYAKPDMSKKSKSQIKNSDNTSKNDTIAPLSSPTDVIMSNLASEGNDGQELVTNSNTDDVNELRRNPDYEVVDLDDVLSHKASDVAPSNDVKIDPVDEPELNVIKNNEYEKIDIENNTLLSTYENSPTETTDDVQADSSLIKPIEQSDTSKMEDIYSKPDMSKKRNRQNKSDEQ
ncbi:uncharacterized protein [Antedon mediterranea]|uniref:uncharacterized protein n=1 Tax=Antedon mediterranea TaxID=105859 RepID=UPI003AF78246